MKVVRLSFERCSTRDLNSLSLLTVEANIEVAPFKQPVSISVVGDVNAGNCNGLREAGVRSVKHHLRHVIGDHKMTFEEFTTLLCNVEACLNSRPIAPLHDAIDDYETLTPGHFLIGSALKTIPEPSVLDIKENRLSR